MRNIRTAWLLATLIAGPSMGQVPSDAPRFDAVSIRPSVPGARGGGYNLSPGRLNAKNQSLKDLVQFAYDLHDYQLSGGQGWMESERYEILATFPGATSNAQRAQMMQTALADRFALVVHRETREITGYALVKGKAGPKLHQADGTEHGMILGRNASTGQRTLTGSSATPAELASLVADLLGRPVEDKTGAEGIFDFVMEWTPDSSMGGSRSGQDKVAASDADPSGPTIFTALQEQLGLKLETEKVAVGVVVIDRAEKPNGN